MAELMNGRVCRGCILALAGCAAISACASLFAQQSTQPIPVGLDAYRQWDRWPEQRIGMRAYMRSTYDRAGGNEGADASHFLYQKADDFNVTLDVEGAGVLVFSRFNHWHGSPWHFVVDGADHIVEETSTKDPLHPDSKSTFLPEAAFPAPLNQTWAVTKGADLIASPIAFKRSFSMAYTRTRYGTGYYIYDLFAPGTPLSQPIESWNESEVPDRSVLDLIARSGSDIAPQAGTTQLSGTIALPSKGSVSVAEIKGRATLRAIKFSIPRESAAQFQNARLKITWDGREEASVDAPIALFFGAGTLFNRDGREYLVKAFPVNIRFTKDRIELACYFPMPFFRSARVELVGADAPVPDVQWSIRSVPLLLQTSQTAYFHATYRDIPNPEAGHDMVLLDSRGLEGSTDWSGSFVGTSFIFSHAANLTTLEGDPRFFFDDSLTPQAQGTGTEEWGGGGDYWGGVNMSLPFVGHPVGARNAKSAVNDEDRIESAYRFLLADLMPFGKNAVIRLEHGGTDESKEHYESVAYWYGLPAASLVQTDRLDVGDAESEQAHRYRSPQATQPYTISSRYEWGVDHVHDVEVYPESEARGRTTTGSSIFQLKLRPDNVGVLLRRKLDYLYPNQRAEVYVSSDGRTNWRSAGIWYLAGSNRCVYSNPKGELDPSQHTVEISNRRLRDDEFLVSRDLTRGRRTIWVKVKSTPVEHPLLPGDAVAEEAWSEMSYTAYSFVIPEMKR